MAEQNMNIYQKLAKIRKQVEVIQRNKAGYLDQAAHFHQQEEQADQ